VPRACPGGLVGLVTRSPAAITGECVHFLVVKWFRILFSTSEYFSAASGSWKNYPERLSATISHYSMTECCSHPPLPRIKLHWPSRSKFWDTFLYSCSASVLNHPKRNSQWFSFLESLAASFHGWRGSSGNLNPHLHTILRRIYARLLSLRISSTGSRCGSRANSIIYKGFPCSCSEYRTHSSASSYQ